MRKRSTAQLAHRGAYAIALAVCWLPACSTFSTRIRVPHGGWCEATPWGDGARQPSTSLRNATSDVIEACHAHRAALVRHIRQQLLSKHAARGNTAQLTQVTADDAYRDGGLTEWSQGSTNIEQFDFLVSLVQSKVLHHRAGGDEAFVINVCETGFNWGTSSLAWLCASPKTRVFSFDLENGYKTASIGGRPYIHAAHAWLRSQFPDRLTLKFGDSFHTVSDFVGQQHRKPLCDIVFVDGGHDAANAVRRAPAT